MPEKTTVLVVEDDAPSLANLRLLLELEGFRVLAATDGVAGLAALRRHRPDIVVCDIMMPGMDGRELLAKVREDEGTAATPFIFLTALADRASQRGGMEEGADDYLTKPFAPQELLGAIAARLKRRQSSGRDGAAVRLRIEVAEKLSRREMEILTLIGRGFPSRRIAGHFGISLRTVDSHRANIIAKLDLDGAAGLVSLAARLAADDPA